MKLHPDLLKACAAYLAHADAYCLDDPAPMLRADVIADQASGISKSYSWEERVCMARATGAAYHDDVARAHIEAIRRHAQHVRVTTDQIVRTRDIARAILDATPSMLAWWCERLAR